MNEQFFFDNLNPEQRKAVEYLNGSLLIMAGAGSGKTRVLTYRIANMTAQGISPWNILAITFTNKAANEMRSRAEKLIGAPVRNIVLSTFHSFCARLLRREIEVTGRFTRNFTICDAADSKNLVKQCVNELELGESVFSNVHLKISDLKGELISPAKFREQSLDSDYIAYVALIYELYQKKLQKNNALDFDDLIFTTVQIFKDCPDVLKRYQERFKYISVDEYQDTNAAQYELTNLLAAKYKNLCVVGDADQSIYGWRGADMRNILNFERDYPDAKVILLEQNYRSTKTILRAANAVIQNNFDRKPKNLWTQNESGEKIKFFRCETDLLEALTVAREIRRLVEYEHFNYNDIALLYRTNAQSRLLEERLMREEIPYIIIGGLKFYDRKEIKDILAYLHVISNPRDDLHLVRIINVPRRGLGLTNLTRLTDFATGRGLSIMEVVSDRNLLAQVPDLSPKFRATICTFAAMMMSFTESARALPVDKLILTVLNESGYMRMLRETSEDGKLENISREENLGTFIDSAKEFIEVNPLGTLEDFLNHVALITDLDTLEEKDSRVKLMTIHAAKGLEFPAVFVTGMEEKIFPHANALGSESELEEERRACYVALTRAKKKLYLTAAETRKSFGNLKIQDVSRFVEEIPAACVEYFGNFEKKAASSAKKASPPKFSYKPPTAYRAAQIQVAAPKDASPPDYQVGDMINHKKWGVGTVMAVTDNKITVSFANPEHGIKIFLGTATAIGKL